jgi:hypothetical protein
VRSSQSGNCTLRTHGLPTSLSPNKEERAMSVNMRERDRRKPRKVGFVRGMLHVHWKLLEAKLWQGSKQNSVTRRPAARPEGQYLCSVTVLFSIG